MSSVLVKVPYEDLNLPHSQQRHEPLSFFSGRHFRLHLNNALYNNEEGKVWIPSDDVDLQLLIYVISLAGIGGNRLYEATIDAIQDHFFWETLNSDIDVFCLTCLRCKLH